MNNFKKFFTTYENTDPPPIITPDYKKVKDTFELYSNNLDEININEDYSSKLSDNLIDASSFTFDNKSFDIDNKKVDNVPSNKSRIKLNNSHDNVIINYFINKGLTLNQAKGIYGNLMQESRGKLDAVSTDGYYSYGIAQWTGPRKEKLFEKYGTSPTLQNQLDFLWEELNTTEKKAFEALKNTQTLEDATRVFMTKFERPNAKYANYNKRLQYAKSII